MIGVLMKYFLNKVMHFSHDDFMTAFRVDLGPLLGECGLWVLKNYEVRMSDKGRDDKKKLARCLGFFSDVIMREPKIAPSAGQPDDEFKAQIIQGCDEMKLAAAIAQSQLFLSAREPIRCAA